MNDKQIAGAASVKIFGKNKDNILAVHPKNLNTATSLGDVAGCISLITKIPNYKLPEGVTFGAMTTGGSQVQNALIEEFPDSVTFVNLTGSGTNMFAGSKIKKLGKNMFFASLQNATGLFLNNFSLSELPEGMTLENLNNAYVMFYGCPLTTLPTTINLKNLSSAERMFSSDYGEGDKRGGHFDRESILRILNTIPEWQDDGDHKIHLGYRNRYSGWTLTYTWANDEEIATLLGTSTPIAAGTYSYKGWTIAVR